jgi:hypothetical protein
MNGMTGPFTTLSGVGGESVPLYMIPFDSNGVCTGPRSLDELIDVARTATDVFVVAHGWNNTFQGALDRYVRFAAQYTEARQSRWNPPNRPYRGVIVGLYWPSTALLSESEQAPDIAGPTTHRVDDLTALAAHLDPTDAALFYDLATRERLDVSEAKRLADLLAPVLAGGDGTDELDRDVAAATPADLVEVWQRLATPERGADGGFIDESGPVPRPATAGLLDVLNPKNIVRGATVLLMKDRAGRVGGTGVATMLRRLVDASPDARVHLVGHSYGAKVVMSAVCNGPAPARPVESVLLLQPAMSCLCFATDADGKGHPGGYRVALERVRQPILTTFSRHDMPLTKLFHLAVRRASDLARRSSPVRRRRGTPRSVGSDRRARPATSRPSPRNRRRTRTTWTRAAVGSSPSRATLSSATTATSPTRPPPGRCCAR